MEQTLALLLTGIVAVPILQLLKRYLKLSGTPMVWIAFIASLFLATLALLLTGKATLPELLKDPFTFFGSGGLVMSLATVIYRTLKEKLFTS